MDYEECVLCLEMYVGTKKEMCEMKDYVKSMYIRHIKIMRVMLLVLRYLRKNKRDKIINSKEKKKVIKILKFQIEKKP